MISNRVSQPKYESNVMLTPEGGLAVLMLNHTNEVSVKGTVVHPSSATAGAVLKSYIGVPDAIGVIYNSGVPNEGYVWVVMSGIADVLFVGDTVMGHLARTFVASETETYALGKALSEAVPTSPFASDKHFCEIGHVIESRTGAGLAKCVLHFN